MSRQMGHASAFCICQRFCGVVNCCSCCAMQSNVVTYTTLIHTALACGDIEEALALMRAMEEAGLPLTQQIWGAIMLACGQVRDTARPCDPLPLTVSK